MKHPPRITTMARDNLLFLTIKLRCHIDGTEQMQH